jgi:hypothetical protein
MARATGAAWRGLVRVLVVLALACHLGWWACVVWCVRCAVVRFWALRCGLTRGMR